MGGMTPRISLSENINLECGMFFGGISRSLATVFINNELQREQTAVEGDSLARDRGRSECGT